MSCVWHYICAKESELRIDLAGLLGLYKSLQYALNQPMRVLYIRSESLMAYHVLVHALPPIACVNILAPLPIYFIFSHMMSGKWPATSSEGNTSKMSQKSISMDVKLQVIRHLQVGEHQVDDGTSLKLATLMIRTMILKKMQTS